ncbi:hypothetical protein N7510_006377 [Penicillium lagena]|uniref:uncharacterized protein n=1 Tax=Penicillium lagena TaxID=94218 RepID=UPI00254053A8|nr:uncharacterized protein N7510_006377 [Penicillium lagena]KAJ5613183.1 hypothetical protein N7510_006377 [Penicillium lagena]
MNHVVDQEEPTPAAHSGKSGARLQQGWKSEALNSSARPGISLDAGGIQNGSQTNRALFCVGRWAPPVDPGTRLSTAER